MLNIIMPAYNCSETLPQALGSLMAQTKPMFFVTIIDDNSTEDLKPIIDKYKQFLKIIYVKNEKNIGPGASRQRGIDMGTDRFDYVMFLDSDDFLYPRAVEILYSEARKTGADIIFSPIVAELPNGEIRHLKLGKNTTWCHGKIYRTKFLKKKNIRFPDFKMYNEDSYFNLIANFMAEQKRTVEEPFYLWKSNPKSLTRNEDGDFAREYYIDYVRSQLMGLQFLADNHEYSKFFAGTLAKLYCSFQIQKILDKNKLEDLLLDLKKLGKHDTVKKLLFEDESLKYLSQFLVQSMIMDKELFIFDETFRDWCKDKLEIILN